MFRRSVIALTFGPLAGCGLVIGLSPVSFDAPFDADAGPEAGAAEASGDGPSGSGPGGPRCAGLLRTCGANEDCCASAGLDGGTFKRGYDGVFASDATHEATVSPFVLDTFEVTVGRFRAFVADSPKNLPAAGAGKDPNNANDPGWDATWSASLPSGTASFVATLDKCDGTPTWSDSAPNDSLPMNCITWFEAFAFCIWDSGRLPTDAEWNFAGSAGAEQRIFPWSSPPDERTVDSSYAVYLIADPAVVGSKKPGRAEYGGADLAGNVGEWVLDGVGSDPTDYLTPCVDCADLRPANLGSRGYRGGDFNSKVQELFNAVRLSAPPDRRSKLLGVRCARN
jgi:formylglycine-generating enzyme required for sulfatase activity